MSIEQVMRRFAESCAFTLRWNQRKQLSRRRITVDVGGQRTYVAVRAIHADTLGAETFKSVGNRRKERQ
jgi:hypothetical protein